MLIKLIIYFIYLYMLVIINASTIKNLNSISQNDYGLKKLKRNELINDLNRFKIINSIENTNLDIEDIEEVTDEESLNQTLITSEELTNQKEKEIVLSQQILMILCIGFLVLLFAIGQIIMSFGKTGNNNRKYQSMQY